MTSRDAVMQPSERPHLPADGALPDDGILLRRSEKGALPLFADGGQAVERQRFRPAERDDELCPLIGLPHRSEEGVLCLPLGLPAAEKGAVRGGERIGDPLQKGEVHFAALFKRLDRALPRDERLRALVPLHPEEVFFPVVDGLCRDPRNGIAEGKEFAFADRLDLFPDDHLLRIRQDIGDRPVLLQDEVPAHVADNGIPVRRQIAPGAAAEKIVIFTQCPQHTSSFAYAPTSITPSHIFGR